MHTGTTVAELSSAFSCAICGAGSRCYRRFWLTLPMEHLLDDSDNFGGWRRLGHMGDLRELTFRYGVAAINHERNITFTEQCKEVHPARLPGITVYNNR